MKLAYRALPAAVAAGIALAACSGSSTNPGQAANLQACKDFAAFKAAESASEFPAVAEHNLDVFVTTGPRGFNPNVGEPLFHDLARILIDWREVGYAADTDINKATADCAVVKATRGKSS